MEAERGVRERPAATAAAAASGAARARPAGPVDLLVERVAVGARGSGRAELVVVVEEAGVDCMAAGKAAP